MLSGIVVVLANRDMLAHFEFESHSTKHGWLVPMLSKMHGLPRVGNQIVHCSLLWSVTHAFIWKNKQANSERPLAIVLYPTRELAFAVAEEAKHFVGYVIISCFVDCYYGCYHFIILSHGIIH